MSDVKVLLCGAVLGRFDQLFKRVVTVNAKAGPFTCMLCVGPLFAEGDNAELQPYLDGTKQVPLPTYFIDGLPHGREVLKDMPESGEVLPNLTFLRGGGLLDLHGLKVAYLAGRYDSLSYKDDSALAAASAVAAGEYRMAEVKELVEASRAYTGPPVDVLLTNEWGQGVTAGMTTPPDVDREHGSPVVKDLALQLQPRYHVAGSGGVFVAREPYKNSRGHVTRFLGLGAVGNPDKQKWLHALNLPPAASMPQPQLYSVPPGSTVSPYTLNVPPPPKRAVQEQADPGQYWRFADTSNKRQRPGPRDQPPPLQGDAACRVFVRNMNYRTTDEELASFFAVCGTVAGVRIAIGDDGRPRGFGHVQFESEGAMQRACQMSGEVLGGRDLQIEPAQTETAGGGRGGRAPPPLPPGGVAAGCWFCLSNPEADPSLVASICTDFYMCIDKGPIVPQHVQIVPIEHVPNTVSLSPTAAAEFCRYTGALKKCFDEKLDMDVLLFERYMHMRERGGNHCFVGAVPIPRDAGRAAESTLCDAASAAGFEFEVLEATATWEGQRRNIAARVGQREHLLVTLPNNNVLLHLIKGKGHPVDFMRKVCASMLGKPERADWKACAMDSEAMEGCVEAFKALFKPYDIMD